VGVDRDREDRFARLRLQRDGEPFVREQRRIDPARQVAKVLQRVRGGTLHRIEQGAGLRWIALDHRSHQL